MTAKEIVDIIWAAAGAIGVIGVFIYCTIKVIK